jgi:NADPH:quinone reductase-like Zn-dependent oxidoreductase
MKAFVYSEYGGPEVLRHQEVDTPTPADGEILVRVHAAAVNPADWHLVRGTPFPIRMATGGFRKPDKPRRVGSDYSGTVEAVGRGVTGFSVGDAVFGSGSGSIAEYLVASSENGAVKKPERSTFEQAAAVPLAGLTALQALRDQGKVRAGQKVLIIGAGGGIGHIAVQLAKAFGAEVTGVQSTGALEMVRSIGADHVIDYTKEDFTKLSERYDVIFDNVANHSFTEIRRALKPGATFIPNGGGTPDKGVKIRSLVRLLLMRMFITEKIGFFITKPNRGDLQFLADRMQAGTVTPVIDRCYPFSAAADALRYLETGHAHGKVVISMT